MPTTTHRPAPISPGPASSDSEFCEDLCAVLANLTQHRCSLVSENFCTVDEVAQAKLDRRYFTTGSFGFVLRTDVAPLDAPLH